MFDLFLGMFSGAYLGGKLIKERALDKRADREMDLYKRKTDEIDKKYDVDPVRSSELYSYIRDWRNHREIKENLEDELKFIYGEKFKSMPFVFNSYHNHNDILINLLLAKEGKIHSLNYHQGFLYVPRDPSNEFRRYIYILNEAYKKIDPILELGEIINPVHSAQKEYKDVESLYLSYNSELYKPFIL